MAKLSVLDGRCSLHMIQAVKASSISYPDYYIKTRLETAMLI
jgi:hypothetical protein